MWSHCFLPHRVVYDPLFHKLFKLRGNWLSLSKNIRQRCSLSVFQIQYVRLKQYPWIWSIICAPQTISMEFGQTFWVRCQHFSLNHQICNLACLKTFFTLCMAFSILRWLSVTLLRGTLAFAGEINAPLHPSWCDISSWLWLSADLFEKTPKIFNYRIYVTFDKMTVRI